MSRTLAAGMTTAVGAMEGYADIWLLSITSSGGTTYVTSASQSATYDGNTYVALGGALELEAPSETPDLAAQGMRMTLAGVDQTVIADILGNHMRGQPCVLYFGQVLLSTGVVADAPIQVFAGLLNEPWNVVEAQGSGTDSGTVTVTTTAVSDLARYLFPRPCRTNLTSHNDMLDRASLATGDTLMKRVPELVGQQITWGRNTATPSGGGGGRGPGGEGDQ